MTRLVLLLGWLVAIALPSYAEEVVAGLSRDQVSITANFNGSDILIYGAVIREQAIRQDNKLHVIITVIGPKVPITVRKKDRRFGIWVNTDKLEIPKAPSFYAVASTGPISEILHPTDDTLHEITIPRAVSLPQASDELQNPEAFREALVRIRQSNGLFQSLEGKVSLFDDTLFSTTIEMPSNLVEGDYTTRIFLARDGFILDEQTAIIQVKKVGLERWIYNLAHNQPLIYGLLSLAIAITAGWLASAFFRYFRF